MPLYRATPLKFQLGDQYFDFANQLTCPRCDFEYTRFGIPVIEKGNDGYEASWPGRGDLLVIPFEGECGHRFEICFGFHKGNTHAFVRTTKRGQKLKSLK